MDKKKFLLKKIEKYFLELDEIPLFRGDPISFEEISTLLSKEINKEIKISRVESSWEKTEEFLSSSKKIFQNCFTFAPLSGNLYLLIENEEKEKLISCLLFQGSLKNIGISFKEGFFRYLVINLLKVLKQTKTFSSLTPKIVEDVEIKAKECFFIKTKIDIDNLSFFVTIALTNDFKKSWNKYFASKDSIYSEKIKQSLEIPLTLSIGHTSLDLEKLETLSKGDFLILEKAYLDPKTHTGNIILQIGNLKLFQAKIKKDKIEITDFINFYEKGESMEKIKKEPLGKPEKKDTLKKIPLTISVELSKISITLDKLTKLQPGNFLELTTSLEEPVSLTVNNKEIAKAELAYLGEILGIRILEIG